MRGLRLASGARTFRTGITARAAAAGLAAGILITYALAWLDLRANGQSGSGLGSVVRAIPESLRHWVGILVYWWLPVLALVVAAASLAALWGLVAQRAERGRRGVV